MAMSSSFKPEGASAPKLSQVTRVENKAAQDGMHDACITLYIYSSSKS